MRPFLKICLAATLMLSACNKSEESGIDALNDADRVFASNTARLYLTNIALGDVTFDHGTDTAVVRLAERMILTSNGAYTALIETSRAKGMAMPNSMTDEQEALAASLQGLSGDALDSAYLSLLLQQQDKLVTEFSTVKANGNNAMLKDHANRYNDTLTRYRAYTDSLAQALYP